ncbi:MAG: SDR family NAD(P)-dependent oxidoreductase, partial [Acidimicrobiales bacterium]
RGLAVTLDGGLLAPDATSGVGPAEPSTSGWAPRQPAGASGLLKAMALEYPELSLRCVDLPADEVASDPTGAAELLVGEVEEASGPLEVTWARGVRTTSSVVAIGLATGLPARRGTPAAAGTLRLNRDSVVLLTGGARGITAAVAAGVNARFGCQLEIVGRTDPLAEEDPHLAGATDLREMRRHLAEAGDLSPASIDSAARSALSRRQARSNLEALTAAGARVRYHRVDVTDSAALGGLVDDVYARHGRLDAVLHGAGIIDDRLMRDKDPASFASVYATKVDAARTILGRLLEGPGLVVLFASISGVTGNRGQVDYAAANAALDSLARSSDGTQGWRVVSLDWGPWAGAGMVDEALQREYARRGVELIDLDQGVSCVLEVMDGGLNGYAQALLLAGPPGAVLSAHPNHLDADRVPVG